MALIRREDVWALVGDHVMTVRPGSKLEWVIHHYANAIDGAPEVDAAPVVYGSWRTTRIETIYKVRKTIGALEFCTVCGKPMEDISKYCPNCGAKMMGVIKGETDKS